MYFMQITGILMCNTASVPVLVTPLHGTIRSHVCNGIMRDRKAPRCINCALQSNMLPGWQWQCSVMSLHRPQAQPLQHRVMHYGRYGTAYLLYCCCHAYHARVHLAAPVGCCVAAAVGPASAAGLVLPQGRAVQQCCLLYACMYTAHTADISYSFDSQVSIYPCPRVGLCKTT